MARFALVFKTQLGFRVDIPCCLELYSEILNTEYNSVLLVESENEVEAEY